jgi:hypothetical protein
MNTPPSGMEKKGSSRFLECLKEETIEIEV